MKGCNYIRERIDEADKPDALSFEVTEHIGRCVDCESFASERAGLRQLLASDTRVTAPMNFDALLNSRLAEVKTHGAFSWFSPAGFMRLGAATAGLVVMVFAAQYAGLFSDQSNRQVGSVASKTTPQLQPRDGTSSPTDSTGRDRSGITSLGERENLRVGTSATSRIRRGGIALSGSVATAGYSIADDGGVVLLRGQNGSTDVPMPTVSVGAQPALYVSAGQRLVRSAGTSF